MSRYYTAKAATGTYSWGPLATDEVVQTGQYDHPYTLDTASLALGGGTAKLYGSPATSGTAWNEVANIVVDGVIVIISPYQRMKVTLTGAAAGTFHLICGRN